MSELVDFVLSFLSLDLFNVGHHVSLGVVLGELLALECVEMESSQRDELEDVAHLSEVLAEVEDLLVAHVEGGPVE